MSEKNEYLILQKKKQELQCEVIDIQTKLADLRSKLFEAGRQLEGLEQIEKELAELEVIDRR